MEEKKFPIRYYVGAGLLLAALAEYLDPLFIPVDIRSEDPLVVSHELELQICFHVFSCH